MVWRSQHLNLYFLIYQSSLGAWFGFMMIDFGSIKSYNVDRGFGFVGCTLVLADFYHRKVQGFG